MTWLIKKKFGQILTIIFSASLFGLSFNLTLIGLVISLIALIPPLIVLNQPKITGFKSGWYSLVYFFIFYVVSNPWYFKVLPLNWTGSINHPLIEYLLISLVLIISGLAFGVPFALSGYLYFKLKTPKELLNNILLIALLTVSFYLSAFFASLIFLGSETLIGPHWTIGNLGYILADHPILRLPASIFGLYGLTILVIALNLIFYWLIKKSKWLVVFIIFSLIFISYFVTIPTSLNRPTIKTVIITTDYRDKESAFDQEPKVIFKDLALKIEFLLTKFPDLDLIVIPEDSRLFVNGTKITNDHPLDLDVLLFQQALIGKNVTLVDSARLYLPDHSSAQTVIMTLNTKDMATDFSYKSLLAPLGEYIPYPIYSILKVLGYDEQLADYQKKRTLRSGQPKLITTSKNYQLGILLCSEIVSPYLYRDLTKKGANILINPSSQSLFNNSKSVDLMTKRMAQIRALENNRYLAISANSSHSYLINNLGQVLINNNNPNDYIIYDIPIIKSKSLANFLY